MLESLPTFALDNVRVLSARMLANRVVSLLSSKAAAACSDTDESAFMNRDTNMAGHKMSLSLSFHRKR